MKPTIEKSTSYPMSDPLNQLAMRAQAGDELAREELAAAIREMSLRWFSPIATTHEADFFSSEVAILTMARLAQWEPLATFKTFIYRTGFHSARTKMFRQRKKRGRYLPAESELTGEEPVSKETKAAYVHSCENHSADALIDVEEVNAMLRSNYFTRNELLVLRLFWLSGYSCEEVGDRLGFTVGQIYQLNREIRCKLNSWRSDEP